MTSRSSSQIGRRLRSLYSWHRWLGIAAALFVLLFAFTGLALNHSAGLGLDQTYLQHPLWQSLYGGKRVIHVQGIERNNHWLSQADGRLYLDDKFITHGTMPVDALWLDTFWVIATRSELILVDAGAEVIERITAEQLPGRIQGLARQGNQLRLRTAFADFTGDLNDLNWRPVPRAAIQANHATATTPTALSAAIQADIRQHSLTAERLLLDLHSGHLFGLSGVIVMDSAAVALIALGLSGLLLWLRYRHKQRQRRRRARQKRRESMQQNS